MMPTRLTGYTIPRLAPPRKGDRLTLPSGRIVVLLKPLALGSWSWDCAFIDAANHVMPPGNGERNRVSLSEQFLRTYAIPVT